MRVQTTNFEFAHGRKPRGFASWGFGPEKFSDFEDIVFITGNFAEAKKQAQEAARQRGWKEIHVQS